MYYEVNDGLLSNQNEPNTDYFYIVDDFVGEYFSRLRDAKKFIFGTTALKNLIANQDTVVSINLISQLEQLRPFCCYNSAASFL